MRPVGELWVYLAANPLLHLTLTLVADECVFWPAGAAHLLETRDDGDKSMIVFDQPKDVAGTVLLSVEKGGGVPATLTEAQTDHAIDTVTELVRRWWEEESAR